MSELPNLARALGGEVGKRVPMPNPSPQHVALANLFDEDRFDTIQDFADKQISLWLSVREAAYRRERSTLEIHCRAISVLTRATFQTVKGLGLETGRKVAT